MVLEKIKEIISAQLDKDPSGITPETSFIEDLEADSLDLFQIINDIEDEFDIKIEDAEDIKTVKDAVDFVENQRK